MTEDQQVHCFVPSAERTGSLAPMLLDDLIAERVDWVCQQYRLHPNKEVVEGAVVDSFVFYTLQDRPVVKEYTTPFVDKRFIAKEFEKKVKLASVKELPRNSEILDSRLIDITPDILATDPWLADRSYTSGLLDTSGTALEGQPTSHASIAASGPKNSAQRSQSKYEHLAPPAVTSDEEELSSGQSGFVMVSHPQSSASEQSSSVFSMVQPEDPHGTSVPQPTHPLEPSVTEESSTASKIASVDPTSQPDESTASSAKKRRNPFKRFIKMSKTRSPHSAPVSPRTPSSPNNPFGAFVQSNGSRDVRAYDGAIVPVAQVNDRPKKGLKWFFSAPFSGPKDPIHKAGSLSSASGKTPPETAPAEVSKKPTLEPFLNQSLNNSDLGKKDDGSLTDTEGATPSTTQPSIASARGPPRSQSSIGAQSSVSRQPLPNHAGVSGQEATAAGPRPQPGSIPGPAHPPAEQKQSPSRSPQSGQLQDTAIQEDLYNAAAARCRDFLEADKQKAQDLAEGEVLVEYFVLVEEHWTKREVIETFVQHNYYLLEHVLKIVYRGERSLLPSVELLSRDLLAL